jgi:7-keto-8-aminopelargonate synthetase-like enzyme
MHAMDTTGFFNGLAVDRSALKAAAFNPYYRPLRGFQNGQPWIGRHAFFDLASNDYLGLATDPRVRDAVIAAVDEYGSSMCGTPIACGYAQVLSELERELAAFVGLEDALVFPSCYQANVALFPAVATPADVILIDHYAHASLGQGVKAVGCKVRPFLHNDVGHLERLLAGATGFRQVFVVTESVFSTSGNIAPLHAIVDLCRHFGAIPVVDDSHGIGVLGKRGCGILEDQDIRDFPGIYTASLGKALANAGGVVAGCQVLIDALRYCCPGLIYSTALPPPSIAGTLCTLQIISNEFDLLGRTVLQNHELLLQKLAECNFAVAPGRAPIAAIRSGSTADTIALAARFYEHRILATPFVPPSVPANCGVLRLILGAKLDVSGVGGLMRALASLAKRSLPQPVSEP